MNEVMPTFLAAVFLAFTAHACEKNSKLWGAGER